MKINEQSFSREIGWELNGPLLRHGKAKLSVNELDTLFTEGNFYKV
jgi:hypothetical protein